nr:MAG TPA: hypothetical protein [Bacteriophage sp.]
MLIIHAKWPKLRGRMISFALFGSRRAPPQPHSLNAKQPHNPTVKSPSLKIARLWLPLPQLYSSPAPPCACACPRVRGR